MKELLLMTEDFNNADSLLFIKNNGSPLLLQQHCSPSDKDGLSPPSQSRLQPGRYLMWLGLA